MDDVTKTGLNLLNLAVERGGRGPDRPVAGSAPGSQNTCGGADAKKNPLKILNLAL